MIRNFDHCIFCQVSFKIFEFDRFFELIYFCFCFVALSFLRVIIFIFFIIDTIIATYLEQLQKNNLQTIRKSFRIKQKIAQIRQSTLCKENDQNDKISF